MTVKPANPFEALADIFVGLREERLLHQEIAARRRRPVEMTMTLTFNTSVGPFESPFSSNTAAALALETLLSQGAVPVSQRGFAESLMKAWREGRCSERQLAWIHIIPATPLAMPNKARVVDFNAVAALLDVAKGKGLLRPKLRFRGMKIAHGWRDGSVVVIKNGKPVAEMDRTRGALLLRPTCTAEDEAALRELAADPVKVTSVEGLRTNYCCYCGLQLTAAESVGNGYGPICAEKWGLPWAGTEQAKRERDLRKLQRLAADEKALRHEVQP
jgi:hypothetical protein